MSKVAHLFNERNTNNWEVIDFFIIGFFLFFGVMLMFQFAQMGCMMNNYYHGNCYYLRDFVNLFRVL